MTSSRAARGVTAVVALACLLTALPLPVSGASVPLLRVAPGQAVPSTALRTGDLRPADSVTGQVVLRLRNPAGLEARTREQARAGSTTPPLTAAQFQALYAPATTSVARVAAYLRAAGVEVTGSSGTLVDFRAPAAAAERAFHASLGRYTDAATGQAFTSTGAAATLPADIAPSVLEVVGLDTRSQWRPRLQRSQPRAAAGPDGNALNNPPLRLQKALRLNAAPLAGLQGTSTAPGIGILELAVDTPATVLANLRVFDAQMYLGQTLPAPAIKMVDGGALLGDIGGQEETDLDVQTLRSVAPQQAMTIYEAPNTNQGVNDGFNQMVTDGVKIISTSWGECEQLQDQSNTPPGYATETDALRQIFIQAAAQGVTTFAASGDSGAFDCYNSLGGSLNGALTADSPASDPNVVGVGGTAVTSLAPDGSIAAQQAWASAPNHQGTGGGLSVHFATPGYQSGPGVLNGFSNGLRQVPDVAIPADPGLDPYTVYTEDQSASTPGWLDLGGTSAGPPQWAGFLAIYGQWQPARPVVSANAQLYGAAQCPQSRSPFSDVPPGTNNLYYPTTDGWDFATGWGTMRADDLARDIAGLDAATLAPGAVYPNSGSTVGGRVVAITGCGFSTGSTPTVSFGGAAASSVAVASSTALRVTVPAHAPGTVNVTVTNAGSAPATISGAFTYAATRTWGAAAADGSLHGQPGGAGVASLGGIIIGAPAVVGSSTGPTLFIGVGTDHDLWVRTVAQGWRRLNTSPVYCLDNPAAAVVGSTLWVACEGGDHALWYSTVAAGSGVPLVSNGWSTLGGFLVAGPAVDGVAGSSTPTFAVLGSDGQVWTRTPNTGYSPAGWRCVGHPALASGGGTGYFACHGTDGALWYATNGGSGWSRASSLGGGLVDGPGIAADSGGATFFVEGSDAAVWQRGPTTGWTSAGDSVRHGVGAGSGA